ncbi:septum formation initiator family protein [Cohnella thailandensis]|uniref:Septum formation initiator family protein n=1 Tax=Cohnella thailandensis TaxID=557557 RepID=A0A841T190_9BACL|nr:septum formation initiator family protein [Cohnella thailandensis]MBP1977718.1 cell division protein DivIC [Cohnella thailandensis]
MASNTAAASNASVGARRRLKLLLAVVVLFMSWAIYTLFMQYNQAADRNVQLIEAKKQLSDAQAKNVALKQEVARLNDPEYIGQIARKEQGMGLPGEKSIQMENSAP